MTNPDPFSQNRAAYDQIAARFAERNAEMLPYVIESAQRLLAGMQTAGKASLPILDLGCGTGRDMAWLESQGAKMIGADLSGGMLAEACRIARGPLCQLDMRFLPFASDSLGGVWCQAALLHLPKSIAPAALQEIRRVLADGGLLHISVQKGNSEGFETRPYEPVERYYAHYQASELTNLLQSAGFCILYQGEAEARRSWIYASAQK